MPTKIPWCDEVLNVTTGCTKCSPGCLNCYAERMAHRLAGMEEKAGREPRYSAVVDNKGWMGNVICEESILDKPLHWKKPRRIFIDSMSDLFHPEVPFEFIHKVFTITQKAYQHTYLILTKRADRMLEFVNTCIQHGKNGQPIEPSEGKYYHACYAWPHPNVHLGVSISNQAEADEKIPILLQIPAAVRWLSVEPMLEEIDLHLNWAAKDCKGTISSACTQLHGIIVGCESGPKRRPCKMEWIYGIVNQCRDANIPCYVKQINLNGEVVKMPKEFPQEYPIVK